MRHGETTNNILGMISKHDYETKRTHEPEMSEIGNKSCTLIGQKLKELGVNISRVFCAAHKRAVISASLVRKGLEQESLPIHLMVKAHEF